MNFDQLPPETQTALFTDAALEALTKWRIPHAQLELLSLRSNAVFAAGYPEYPDDFKMVLRVNWPGRKSLRTIRYEGLWIDILSRAGLPVPNLIRPVSEINISRSPLAFRCSLFGYQEGASLVPRDYTPAHVRQIGALAGRIHGVALGILRDTALSRPRLDAEGIFGAASPYASGPEGDELLAPHRPVLEAIRDGVQTVFDKLETHGDGFGLIHGDLKPDNLLFEDGKVRVLDFDDCGWGYYLYDLAPLLLFMRLGLRADGLDSQYAPLKQALWEGYTAVRPQPDALYDELETLAAGRYAASCLWVAAHRDHPAYRGKTEGILASRAAQLTGFLETGTL